ncbi:ATP synthase subunit C [Clostridium fallax]|uniref:V/A-type H+-transporting ATPase subunit K n=1 Tax=Clostridium fallax TaxID=1533 RepID=A0A1M4VV30_9CLOT|nr:ATP synthase subunit C [Clostridium fallax]SHE72809.1 V/A-type H+-transporting ATPase subunit K [Clostridium fallax]SQB07709.1 ATPase related protein [Clostridium fallax]
MYILLGLTFLIVVSTITYGVVTSGKDGIKGKIKIKKALKINLSVFIPIMTMALIMNIPTVAHAATSATSANGLGYLAAGLSTGLATIGAGYAVGAVGSSALGAVSEDPKILGKTLIYVGLGEGIAIYGLIISIMILSRL